MSGKRKQNYKGNIYPPKRRKHEECAGNTNTQCGGMSYVHINTIWSNRCNTSHYRESHSSSRATTYGNETVPMSPYFQNHQIDRKITTSGYEPTTSERYSERVGNFSRTRVQYSKQLHRGGSHISNRNSSGQFKVRKRSEMGEYDDHQASQNSQVPKQREESCTIAKKNCNTRTYRVNDFKKHGFLESKDNLLKRLERIKNIKDFQGGEYEDFKSLLGSVEKFNKENLWCLMKILSNLLQECNTELCEKLIENDFFNRKELRTYVIELLRDELSGSDIIFLRNSSEVLIALSLETTVEARNAKTFLSLIIILTEKLEKNAMLSKKAISSNSLKEIKGRFESGKKDETTFSNPLREKLYNLVNFKILPTSEMIRDKILPNFEPRQLERASRSETHYLAEQFYLFLEDFIGPLREGIQNYIKFASSDDGSSNRIFRDENIRAYEDVHILERKCVPNDGVVIEVEFGTKGLKRVQWDICNFLQYGNIVCLTYGECNILLYALIAERNIKNLNKGRISLSLIEDDYQSVEKMMESNGNIVMLESKAFYTAYRHTLESMKSIARKMYINPDYAVIPFSEHIVELNIDIMEPAYCKRKNGEDLYVNFNCLLQNNITGKSYNSVSLLDVTEWPSPRELGMDEQQYAALQLCLTRKLGILQGPPGTGKTWMGLRVVQFLLNNNCGFVDSEKRPILLLSYTNHALDQIFDALFDVDSLLGLFSAGEIPFVRVGSRSNVERIQQCTLTEHRKRMKPCNSKIYLKEAMKLKQDLFEIELWLNKIKASIVSPSFLFEQGCMIENHKQSLESIKSKCNQPTANSDVATVLKWLEFDACDRNYQGSSRGTNVGDNPNTNLLGLDEDDEDTLRTRLLTRIVDDADDFVYNEKDCLSNVLSKLIVSEELILPKDERNMFPVWRSYTRRERENFLNQVSLRLCDDNAMSEDEEQSKLDLWTLDMNERWRLYKAWIQKLRINFEQKKKELMYDFEVENNKYMIEKQMENTEIVSRCSLVGMTTTGAAQNIDLLRQVQPRIVVVEEAAQVFEQHIIGCLTEGLQHLILIGDHQQLRPPINNYKLSKSHKTDVSMMERLVMNGMPFVCLSQQHRMRPEISSLLTPTIYKTLKDHPSVLNYENVRGFKHNIYFLDHTHPESQTEFSTSHMNEFEAKMIVRLFRYLVLQGYSRQQITILSTYNDQVKLIKDNMKNMTETMDSATQRVTITAVDNFQGEENEIILLSLVRGNDGKKIGHLHDIKRICVSLSRAKQGFYVVGNFQTIRKSQTWNKIISKAESNGICGPYLPLQCVNHPDTITKVSKPDDFDNAPEGGCNEPCGFQHECGHVCNLKCHADRSFHDMPCKKICDRIVCKNGHKCKKVCSHPQSCGPCNVKKLKVYPICKHEVKVDCSVDLETIPCQKPCDKLYPCGHRCLQNCGNICRPDQCDVKTRATHPRCGHEISVQCCKLSNLNEERCQQRCKSILPCGHVCKGDCCSCSSGRLHVVCEEFCQRVLVCGHSCNSKHSCSTICPPCNERCPSGCDHLAKGGCPKKCGEKCIDCREPCLWICDKDCKNQYRCTKLCFEECDRGRCNNRCKKILPCRHRCVGLCGESCPTLCRRCNKDELTTIFLGNEDEPSALYIQLADCNHVFEFNDFDKYMEMEKEKDMDSTTESVVIKLIRCPKCQTPIRRGRRYKDVLNQNLKNIKDVKEAIDKERRNELETDSDEENLNFTKAVEFLTSLLPNCPYKLDFSNKNAEKLFIFFVTKFHEGFQIDLKESGLSSDKMEIMEQFHILLKWLMSHRKKIFAESDVHDFNHEVNRLFLFADFTLLLRELNSKNQASEEERQLIKHQKDKLFWPKQKLSDEDTTLSKDILKNLRDKHPRTGLGISDKERRMILNAFRNSNKGHWYKCKNGHIYRIGNCGGATIESRCPDCNETIGGASHRLRSDNQVAGEMDGATHSAWSEQANMGNYVF